MQRPLVGKLLKVGLLFELANIIRINKINRRDKYAVVQWITPGCELLSDVDYAGPGILYEVTKVLNPSQNPLDNMFLQESRAVRQENGNRSELE